MVYKSFDKEAPSLAYKNASDDAVKSGIMTNQTKNKQENYTNQLSDLANMQLISKFNKVFRFLLCVIDIYSKNVRVVSLKDRKRYYNY